MRRRAIEAERRTRPGGIPEWWRDLSAGEKAVIRGLIEAMRGLKRSEERQVAQAAYKWERGITCFIKLRLMNDRSARRQRTRGNG